jgi:DNA-binding CsgD family transcriptional regulator
MHKDVNDSERFRELVLRLIRQSAKDRASSQKWSLDGLVLICVFFVIILLLDLQNVNTWLVGVIAILGLVILWIFGWFRSRNLERKFYQQELHEYADILRKDIDIDFVGAKPSTPVLSPLTQKEIDILSQMAEGKMNKEIANSFSISESTVKNHISRIFKKLDVNTRTAAVMQAISHGWLKKDTIIK